MDSHEPPAMIATTIELPDAADGGAPYPIFFHSERGTFLLFNLLEIDDGDPKTGVIHFSGFKRMMDLGLNEDSLVRSDIMNRIAGADWGWFFELHGPGLLDAPQSIWTASSSPGAAPVRHFVFLFHDSSLEIHAEDFSYSSHHEKRAAVLSKSVNALFS